MGGHKPPHRAGPQAWEQVSLRRVWGGRREPGPDRFPPPPSLPLPPSRFRVSGVRHAPLGPPRGSDSRVPVRASRFQSSRVLPAVSRLGSRLGNRARCVPRAPPARRSRPQFRASATASFSAPPGPLASSGLILGSLFPENPNSLPTRAARSSRRALGAAPPRRPAGVTRAPSTNMGCSFPGTPTPSGPPLPAQAWAPPPPPPPLTLHAPPSSVATPALSASSPCPLAPGLTTSPSSGHHVRTSGPFGTPRGPSPPSGIGASRSLAGDLAGCKSRPGPRGARAGRCAQPGPSCPALPPSQ